MTNQLNSTAIIYADSLIKSEVPYDVVLHDLDLVNEVIYSSKDFCSVMTNPSISKAKKFSIVKEIFAEKINASMLNFLKILIDKDRILEVDQIYSAFSHKVDDINNVKRVEVISAIELQEAYKDKILKKLQAKLNKSIIPEWKIDEQIIGGLVIKIDDDVTDDSLKNKLEQLSKI